MPDAALAILAASPFFKTDSNGFTRYRVVLYRGKKGGFHVCRSYGEHTLSNCRHFHSHKAAVARWLGESAMAAADGEPWLAESDIAVQPLARDNRPD